MAYRYEDQSAQINVASGINILAGVWLILSPWIYGRYAPNDAGVWNSIVVGVLITLVASIRFASGSRLGLSWINALLGAWTIASPWIYAYHGDALRTWNSVIVGIIVLVLALTAGTVSRGLAAGDAGHRTGGGPYPGWAFLPYGYTPYGVPWLGWEEQPEEPGTFRGRGPRGYARLDEHIRSEVCDRMWAHPRLDASDIDVRVEAGEVILQGTVASRHDKRLAEAIADSAAGVTDVRNELRVRRRSEGSRRVA